MQTFRSILEASKKELLETERISPKLVENILTSGKDFKVTQQALETELATLEKLGGNIITFWDDDYPLLLKNIYSPPLILYILGDVGFLNNNIIAIVGTRTPSDYGKIHTEKFATELSKAGIVIASGMARGIDSIAHNSALNSGGKTIAIIGSGLDIIYPPENRSLFNRIKENGCIISEYPLGTKPDAPNFPKRNRIISGISLGTLVMETRTNGGAIQTAGHALTQNREVFALPGNITSPQSEGTNQLIKRSEAKLVQNVEDILIELNITSENSVTRNLSNIELSLFEENILDKLSAEPIHVDDLAEISSIPVSECLVYLLQLEFKGLVKQLPGKMFISTY